MITHHSALSSKPGLSSESTLRQQQHSKPTNETNLLDILTGTGKKPRFLEKKILGF